MNNNEVLWLVLAAFLAGFIATSAINSVMHRNYYEVTKTNIGEFILRDGKVYGIYEIQRNTNGDMVVK